MQGGAWRVSPSSSHAHLHPRCTDAHKIADTHQVALSVLSVDAENYRACLSALQTMYPRVSDGGFIVVLDSIQTDTMTSNSPRPCEKAAMDYRHLHDLTAEPVYRINSVSVAWQKRRVAPVQCKGFELMRRQSGCGNFGAAGHQTHIVDIPMDHLLGASLQGPQHVAICHQQCSAT